MSFDLIKSFNFLKAPGDRFSARITNTGRKVLKISTDHGKFKASKVQYSNGTTVETYTRKR
ncbi:hypothetical protein SAMN02910384_02901 [Pseudobutyrivibrio sp. ACV-2]|uniref:hypothetical protein n=1 Tax=Pseudobutyrivibrio sp. ACV-2 TaxID=1520801 RepID=UPI00089A780F|nr:hypothetical protein [Pseudobutyrivibrio sp. ACV-2]SEA97197.1 hypothetical protein SAMN02910384_02901 [Pseudobutyrivibrio sp. ACV-2]